MTTPMTIDETIKHYDEVAEAEERSAKLHQRPDRGVKGSGKRYLSCIECAKEHRQLAGWLRELKAYKELNTYNRTNPCSECKHEDSAYNCDYCIWNYVNNFEQKEVNSDG